MIADTCTTEPVLQRAWACLECYWKGPMGQLLLIGRHALRPYCCPRCKSDTVHPAWREVATLKEYFGVIGTRN